MVAGATTTDDNTYGITEAAGRTSDFLALGTAYYAFHYGITMGIAYNDGNGTVGSNIVISNYFGLSFYTSGVHRMRINKNGEVGIGNFTPTHGGTFTFECAGNVGIRTNLYINCDGADGDSYVYFYEGSSTTGAYLKWDDDPGEFVFNKNLSITGSVSATTSISAETLFHLTPGSGPVGPVEGDIYMDSTSHKLRCYDGTIWNDLF
jgi:hypothetical protein